MQTAVTKISADLMTAAVVFLLFAIQSVWASYGDRSYIFQRCLDACIRKNCSSINWVHFQDKQPWYEASLQWSCDDECKYQCMWRTVDAFQKDGIGVPHFYGKWPFLRFYGVQEPASVIFSILNGLFHLRILTYRRLVPSSTPMYYTWQFAALISMHTWFWSMIFHTRDTLFTEMMDYFCAFALVLCNLFTFCCRALGTDKLYKPACCGLILLALFIQHTNYLSQGRFDYGYNMKVNLAVGGVSTVGWLLWCWIHRKPYVWKCVAVVLGLNIAMSLELGDFAPISWIFDAHSLWHASTFPLCYLWYSFLIEDGLHLASIEKQKIL